MSRSRVVLTVFLFVLGVNPMRSAQAQSGIFEPQRVEPAFRLHLEVDLPILLTEGVVILGWFLTDQMAPAYCAPLCDRNTVNAFDRPAAGNYSLNWSNAGDVGAAAVLLLPPVAAFLLEKPGHALNDVAVIVESVLAANFIAVLTNASIRRPRPFMYETKAPLEDRMDANASLSFFSGHTAASFAGAWALFQTASRLRPHSALRYWLLAAGLAGASFVGISRVLAGDHFPTDVLGGALVGSGMGIMVPYLHSRETTLTPASTDGGVALVWSGRF